MSVWLLDFFRDVTLLADSVTSGRPCAKVNRRNIESEDLLCDCTPRPPAAADELHAPSSLGASKHLPGRGSAHHRSELDAILTIASPTARLAFALGAFAGLRRSEVRGPRWADVGPKGRAIGY